MSVFSRQGKVDRHFFNAAERTLFLKLQDDKEIYVVRVDQYVKFTSSIMLTKPGDEVAFFVQGGFFEEWQNKTLDASR